MSVFGPKRTLGGPPGQLGLPNRPNNGVGIVKRQPDGLHRSAALSGRIPSACSARKDRLKISSILAELLRALFPSIAALYAY